MNKAQKKFLLEYFFKNERYAGWRNIAEALVDKGECVVAGDKNIWIGGIGNFIKVVKADGYIDCVKYTFDIDNFKKSKLYIDTRKHYLDKIKEEINVIKSSLDDKIRELSEISEGI